MTTPPAFDSRLLTTPFTLLLVVTVLFGIPRVTAAGYPTAAQVLYVGALGIALVLLSVNIRTLREWM